MSKLLNNSCSTTSTKTQPSTVKPGSQMSSVDYSKNSIGDSSKKWKEIYDASNMKPSLWYGLEKYISEIIVFLTIRFENILYNVACFAEHYIFSLFPALSELVLIDHVGSGGGIPNQSDIKQMQNNSKKCGEYGTGNVPVYISSKYTVLSPANVKLVESEDQSSDNWGHFAEFVDY